MLVGILIAVLIVLLLVSRSLYERHKKLKIKTSIFCHEIRASLAIFNLSLESMKEIVKPEQEKNDSQISSADLPVLIELLEEAKNNLSQTVNQWNV